MRLLHTLQVAAIGLDDRIEKMAAQRQLCEPGSVGWLYFDGELKRAREAQTSLLRVLRPFNRWPSRNVGTWQRVWLRVHR